MQNIISINRNTKHRPITKNQAKIVLTGNFNIKSNIPFEVYRHAIKYDVYGYIIFKENGKSEIVVEAESKAIENFIHWLILFIQNREIHINLYWSNPILKYNEFRIIH